MHDERFKGLDQKIAGLIQLCADMKQENQSMRVNEHHWQKERKDLLENSQNTKSHLEKLLKKLKTLEMRQINGAEQ